MKFAVIADEITAVGWRLAGARILTPDPQAASECLQEALDSVDLVLITAELASHLPKEQLEAAANALPPLVLVMADLRHTREPPDIEHEARRVLGIEL